MRRPLLAGMVLCLGAQGAAGQNDLGSINWYRGLDESAQVSYLMGLTDGMGAVATYFALASDRDFQVVFTDPSAYGLGALRVAFNLAYDDSGETDVQGCTAAWTYGQSEAVFNRYIEEHPEIWHQQVANHFRVAITEACSKANEQPSPNRGSGT